MKRETSRLGTINCRPKPYIDIEEAITLVRTATNTRDRLLVSLLLYTGCRISEALALTIDDIDFVNGTIIIKHLKSKVRLSCPRCGGRLSRNTSFCPGCGEKVTETVASQREYHRQRVIPIDNDTLEMLEQYVMQYKSLIQDKNNLVFGINRHRAWQIIRGCAEKAGLPKLINPETGKFHNISPHKLRDAFAIHAVKLNDSGDGLRMLQEHLGHQSFNTTARYRKVAGEELKDWYNKLWTEDVT